MNDKQLNLPSVAGRMEMTHEAFQRACQVQLMHLNESPLPDNALVHTLCEAVRCSRECCEIAGGSESKEKIDALQSQLTQAIARIHALEELGFGPKQYENLKAKLTQAKEDWQREHAVLKMIANRVCDATQDAQHTNEGICEGVERVCKERDSLQVQRDQVLHLLEGGTLTEQQVTESGLGVGVLSEQRHHEYMRCKAETERDEAVAACAEARHWVEQCADCEAGQDTTAFQAHVWLTESDCGQALLERMKEHEKVFETIMTDFPIALTSDHAHEIRKLIRTLWEKQNEL